MQLRRFVALFLAAVLVTAGTGVGASYSSEIEHDLGIEVSAGDGSLPQDDRGGACDHGCAGHFSVHLLSVTQPQQQHLVIVSSPERAIDPGARPVSSPPGSFFRPPRFSLA